MNKTEKIAVVFVSEDAPAEQINANSIGKLRRSLLNSSSNTDPTDVQFHRMSCGSLYKETHSFSVKYL